MEAIDRFERWFGRSVEKLRELPDGDGGFAALMVAIPLYERLIVGRLKLTGSPTGPDEVRAAIGTDLQLSDRERSIFWDMFRNGFMHHGMARDGKTKWVVSHRFGELPEFKEIRGETVVCLDPWKFADRVLDAFRADHRLITASDSFPLASILLVYRKRPTARAECALTGPDRLVRAGGRSARELLPARRHELVYPGRRVRRDPDEHVSQVLQGIDARELAGLDQSVDRPRGLTPSSATGE